MAAFALGMGWKRTGGAGERGLARSPMRSGKHRKGASKFRMNAPKRKCAQEKGSAKATCMGHLKV